MDRRLENIVEEASTIDFRFNRFDDENYDLLRQKVLEQVEYHQWEIDRNHKCIDELWKKIGE